MRKKSNVNVKIFVYNYIRQNSNIPDTDKSLTFKEICGEIAFLKISCTLNLHIYPFNMPNALFKFNLLCMYKLLY